MNINPDLNFKGPYRLKSGPIYMGFWHIKLNTREGQGQCVWPDGALYEGSWKNGWMHGKGRKIYSNGNCYVGVWKHGLKHGQGEFTSAAGETQAIEWNYGKLVKTEVQRSDFTVK